MAKKLKYPYEQWKEQQEESKRAAESRTGTPPALPLIKQEQDSLALDQHKGKLCSMSVHLCMCTLQEQPRRRKERRRLLLFVLLPLSFFLPASLKADTQQMRHLLYSHTYSTQTQTLAAVNVTLFSRCDEFSFANVHVWNGDVMISDCALEAYIQ